MADIEIPPYGTFESVLFTHPDEPLPSLARFDTLAGQATPAEISRATKWVEAQQVCAVILKHHGASGLQRVLKGIANACSKKRVPMMPRTRAVAQFYGYEIF